MRSEDPFRGNAHVESKSAADPFASPGRGTEEEPEPRLAGGHSYPHEDSPTRRRLTDLPQLAPDALRLGALSVAPQSDSARLQTLELEN